MNEICKCGHHVTRHDHYRRGTDCSAEACGCPAFSSDVDPFIGRVSSFLRRAARTLFFPLPEDESEALRWKRVTVFNYGHTNKRGVEINVFGRWFTFAAEREEKIQ